LIVTQGGAGDNGKILAALAWGRLEAGISEPLFIIGRSDEPREFDLAKPGAWSCH
jgi:hypothetical protein